MDDLFQPITEARSDVSQEEARQCLNRILKAHNTMTRKMSSKWQLKELVALTTRAALTPKQIGLVMRLHQPLTELAEKSMDELTELDA